MGHGGRWKGRWSGGCGIGVKDLHGVVEGGAEVGTVIDCEVKVRSNGKGV